MPVWEFKENMKIFPATLHVLKHKWWIQHYYPGLDHRYNGYLFKIDYKDMPDYIQNLKKSWEKFETIYPVMKNETGVNLPGFGGIMIFINNYGSGISIMGTHGKIVEKNNLDACICELEAANGRANIIQSRLEGID